MAKRPAQYGTEHEVEARHLVATHVAKYGWMCPGDPAYDHDMHQSHDLQADHLVAGRPEHGYEVICATLNQWRKSASRG